MDSRKLKFNEIEYANDSTEGIWFARVKMRNVDEAKELISRVKKEVNPDITARIRGRGEWTQSKIDFHCDSNDTYLPYDMPLYLSDYCMVYFYQQRRFHYV